MTSQVFQDFKKSSISTSRIILIMVIPYYLLAELLIYFELMPYIASIFSPFTDLLNLPPEASLAIAAGVLLNLYAAVAFAAPLGMNIYEWTILGLFLGVMHNMLVEVSILKKIGIPVVTSVSYRFFMAFLAVSPLILLPKNFFLSEPDSIFKPLYEVKVENYETFTDFLFSKFVDSVILSAEIIILVSLVLLITSFIKNLSFLSKVNHQIAMISSMISGISVGIVYGAGVLLSEAKYMTKKQIYSACFFLMTAHAIIEDTLLFVYFGANIWILVLFRLFLAFIVFYLIIAFYKTPLIDKQHPQDTR